MSDQRDSTSESGSGHHNIVLTPDEKKVFGQLFQAADVEGLGVVTGEIAVKFFEKSGLSPRILGEIWGIADTENRGLLTKVGFSVALRLIGQAQNGQHPRPELAQLPGPLPRFEGVIVVQPPPPPTTSSPPPPTLQSQATGPSGMIRVPPLMPHDVERFTALFEKSGAVDGMLPGNNARDIFQRSKLPTATLIQIWNLADRQGRGALGAVEFIVAMHLITCCKNGSLPALPHILPPGLFDAASGRQPTRNGRQAGRGMPPVPPIPKQFSGPQAQRAQSPLSRNFTPPVPQPANAVQRDLTGGWVVSPTDKQRFDAVFLTVDKANRSFITGEEAVPFFSNSNLPEDVLAQIWDLADVNKAGQLNRDEFAIAMYLIVQQRTNPGVPLPETLPANLIPPSMRQQRQSTNPASVPTSPFDPAPPPVAPPKSAADDLFGLDSFGSSTQPQAGPAPTSTAGPFDNDVFGSSKDASPAHSPIPSQGSNLFGRPTPSFVPTSNFGQSIIPTSTGASAQSSRATAPHSKGPDMDDLLGDADPEVSKKLTNESTELANLSNQIGSLTKQTQELNAKRVSAETDLSTLNSQKQHIEAQLAQLRAAYEKEAVQVRRVEEQLAASRAGTTKATQEFQRIEADYNQLQYKRQEVASQLEADKRENENLKERMNAINSENRQLREELERLQSQARRENGLVAINKKQVEKSEQEREKLKSGVEEANRSIVASPAPPASPTLSQGSVSTNPFYRKSPPATDNALSSSFTHSKQSAPSMDDVFSPSFSSTPPPTSFAHKALAEATSSGTEGGRSTPPTSRPSSSIQGSPEAPPPAVSSQITSASLPLPFHRTDSVTSSTQVQPSASVRGDGDVSKAETPTNWTGITAAETSGKEDRRSSFGSALERRNESPFAPLERNTTGTTSGGDESKPRFEKTDSLHSFGNALPGAFPVMEGNTPIKPTPTGESTMSNRSRQSNVSRSAFNNDPFSLNKDETRSNSSKDFDEAFKVFRADEHHTGGSGSVTLSKFNDEFPPIKEIPQDSDSDSDVGFEDNFTSASPAQTRAALTTAKSDDPHTESSQPSGQPPTASVQQATLPFSTDPMSHNAPAAVTSKDGFDDDVFGDLTEAKEADDKSADNDFGTSSGFGDFNPVFDNPTTSHKNQPGQAISDGDDFAKFSFNIDAPTGQSGSQAGSPAHQTAKRASPQDWDAIFAGIGEQPVAQSSSQDGAPAGANDAPDQSGTDPGEGGVSLKSSHDPTTTAPASAPEGAEAGEGRGKEAGSDDEKVTKLTGMGFDRVSSVKALEKNGWNLDLAVNALISDA